MGGKNGHEKFAEQFAALSDNYLKERAAIYVRWVSDCCFILMTLIKGERLAGTFHSGGR